VYGVETFSITYQLESCFLLWNNFAARGDVLHYRLNKRLWVPLLFWACSNSVLQEMFGDLNCAIYCRITFVCVKYEKETLFGNISSLFWISLVWGGGGRAGQKVDIVHQLFSNGDCFMRQTDRQTNMGNRGVASSTTRFVCFFRDNYITWPRTHICSYRVLRISNACYFQTESVVAWNCNCTQM